MTVAVHRLTKRFGSFVALDDVSLAARPGEFLALLGPSGSGKTTLLRLMAGLEHPDAGRVLMDDAEVTDRPTRERAVGFVFQHYALFRHMTVAQNVAFGLSVKSRRERPPRAEIDARVAEFLELVQLGPLGNRYPSQLSGGQRQRVALARALAVRPRILLLDEPFGALDAKVRKDLRRWLRRIHDEMGLTSIFVTHDQDEALELADRVVVMSNGRIEQVDTPQRVYDEPATAFVCDFIGQANRFACTVVPDGVRIGSTLVPTPPQPFVGAGIAYVRPHEFEVRAAGAQGIPAEVKAIARTGPAWLLDCDTEEGPADVAAAELPAAVVSGSGVALMPQRVRVFPRALSPAVAPEADDPGPGDAISPAPSPERRRDRLATVGTIALAATIAVWLGAAVTGGGVPSDPAGTTRPLAGYLAD
jgi:sulfate transport system ATP-binding protein